jgi:hypothetical protein
MPLDCLSQLVHAAGAPMGLIFTVASAFDKSGGASLHVEQLLMAFVSVCVFIVVWFVSNCIEAAIILSPFSFVDPILKSSRSFLMGAIYVLSEIHPALGFIAALCVFVVCLWAFHFSVRCTVVSLVYTFGFFGRMFGVKPSDTEAIKAFSCWDLHGVPLWSRGEVRRTDTGLEFVYNRLFLFWERVVPLPDELSVAVGTINPFLRTEQENDDEKILIIRFSPIYRRREKSLCERLEVDRLTDVSLQTSVRKFFRRIWDRLFGRKLATAVA